MKNSEIEKLETRYAQWKKWRWAHLVACIILLYLVYRHTYTHIISDLPSTSQHINELHKQFASLAFKFGTLFGGIIIAILTVGISWWQKGKIIKEIRNKFNN